MNAFAWTTTRVSEALGIDASPAPESNAEPFAGLSTDSRSVGEGDLFVALVGELFDGHDYVDQAVEAGATGVIVSRIIDRPAGVSMYQVDDTLRAYGALAAHRRAALSATVVGITGSSGKTTTKDLTSGALSGTLRTHATQGNYNNRVGLPRTILEAPEDADVLVLEMGTNEPGEIAALTEVARPDIGVVTTVSESHLEGLGSLEGILQEKLALVRGLNPDGVALVGEDPPVLASEARRTGFDVRVAGLTEAADADLRATDLQVGPDGGFRFRCQGQDVALQIPGEVAVVDALLALGVAQQLGVPLEAAARGVAAVEPGWLRGEVRHVGALTLVLDCYNANPQSVRAAVRTLERMPAEGRKILVLGSMLELGPDSADLHTSALSVATAAGFDTVYASGEFAAVEAGQSVVAIPDVDELGERLLQDFTGSETVLFKASRGVKLERIVPALEVAFADKSADPSLDTTSRGGEG